MKALQIVKAVLALACIGAAVYLWGSGGGWFLIVALLILS